MSSDHPYRFAVEQDGIVYVSGAASIDYETKTPVTGRREAVDAALDEVERRLSTVGSSLDEVTKLIYYLTDVTLRDEANEQFRERFPDEPPARTVIGVAELPYGAAAVIDAVAHRR